MRTIILTILTIMYLGANAQLYTFKATAEDKYLLYYRNDTVLVEPILIGAGAQVSINCDPALLGVSYLIADTEQDCYDFIQSHDLTGSDSSLVDVGDSGGNFRVIRNLSASAIMYGSITIPSGCEMLTTKQDDETINL